MPVQVPSQPDLTLARQTPKNEREGIIAVQELKATNKLKLVLH